MELLIEKYLDSIVKLKAFDNSNKMFKIFTGSFYNPQYSDDIFFPYNGDKILIVTTKHAIKDNRIARLEISFYFNQKLRTCTINLNEYVCVDVQECEDLAIILIKKKISLNLSSRILKSMIFSLNKFPRYSLLNYFVKTLGYYDDNIEPCILENAQIVSPYSPNKFYIKSKNIVESYSGAPVFIEFYSQPNIPQIFLIGYVSKNAGNDNIEVTSAENLLLIDGILKRKYLS